MKIIKVSTENEITVHEFPIGMHIDQMEELYKLIGNGCDCIEYVMPKRLYTDLKQVGCITKIPGQCVGMLVDEEGFMKQDQRYNYTGSFLYETDITSNPIVGNILFVGLTWSGNGIDFCGIEESVFDRLHIQLVKLAGALDRQSKKMEVMQ